LVLEQEELDPLRDHLAPPLVGVPDRPERRDQAAGDARLLPYLADRSLEWALTRLRVPLRKSQHRLAIWSAPGWHDHHHLVPPDDHSPGRDLDLATFSRH